MKMLLNSSYLDKAVNKSHFKKLAITSVDKMQLLSYSTDI